MAEPRARRDTDGAGVLSEEQKRIRLIRAAMDKRATLRVRYNGSVRLVAPHRLWRQPDGSYLLEAYQVAGGSAWGAMGMGGFSRSPLTGWQGWINFKFENIQSIESAGGRFRPRPDYNPNPDRLFGEIIWQLD